MSPHRLPRILSRLGARRFLAPLATAALCTCVAELPSARAQDATLTEWALPGSPNVVDIGQTALPAGDGAVYVTEFAGGKIAKLNTKNNELTEWTVSQTGEAMVPNGLVRVGDRIFFTFASQQPLSSQSASSGSLTWGGASGGAIVVGPSTGGVIAPAQPVTFGGIGVLNLGSDQMTEWVTLGGPTSFPVRGGGHIYFLEPLGNRIASLNLHTGNVTEWELPPPPPATVGSGSILFGGPATGLENFFAGIPTSSGIVPGAPAGSGLPNINILFLSGLAIGESGDDLWLVEGASPLFIGPGQSPGGAKRIARLHLPTNTLTEWPVSAQVGLSPQAHIQDGYVYFSDFSTTGEIARLDPTTNVITVWDPPPDCTACIFLPPIVGDLSLFEVGEDQNAATQSAKVFFEETNPGFLRSDTAIVEFANTSVPGTDSVLTPVTTVLTPTENLAAFATRIATMTVTQLAGPKVTTIPAASNAGFIFWALPTSIGQLSRFRRGTLAFTEVPNKIAIFSAESDVDLDR